MVFLEASSYFNWCFGLTPGEACRYDVGFRFTKKVHDLTTAFWISRFSFPGLSQCNLFGFWWWQRREDMAAAPPFRSRLLFIFRFPFVDQPFASYCMM